MDKFIIRKLLRPQNSLKKPSKDIFWNRHCQAGCSPPMSLELSCLVISPKDLSRINSTLFWRIIFCILIDFDLHYLHGLWYMNKSSLLSLRTNRPFFLSNLFLTRDLLRINSTLLWRIIFCRLIEFELHDLHEQIVPSLIKLVLYQMVLSAKPD